MRAYEQIYDKGKKILTQSVCCNIKCKTIYAKATCMLKVGTESTHTHTLRQPWLALAIETKEKEQRL